jgi:Domain of unknown function (DUF1844)
MLASLAGTGDDMADEETFKVTDRRHREPDPAPEPTRLHAPGTASASPNPAREPLRRDQAGPDLSALLVMFASSALIALGEAPDPETGEPERDLDHAREAIDTLLLLRDKTEGNRTEPESRLLEGILYDLEVRFVRAAQVGR